MIKNISLVSDDDESVRNIENYCLVLGLNFRTIKSDNDLFSHLQENYPDLLIIDFILDDINGGGLCHQLKCDPLFQDLPVALLTEFNSLDRLAPKFGCSYLLTKPLTLRQFLDLLKKVTNIELQN